ncbi:Zn-dependent hydrolase [Paenibacillus spiritus]|uniref:Zn-dependent hydrolase n=1 Tax=Paenibacillus spiritus TaxID=2496557 RepID=A0A5J5GBU8_9BACL|nr:Zn-dependent hydrolase [Paenibacillus spiritus]KAA9005498.1 Zn-dependent hydrolase [Paenibacillus spiritus]
MSGPGTEASRHARAAEEMLELLEELAAFSAPGEGITRLLYTPEWSRAQSFLKERMETLGLSAYADGVGNVFGRLPGTEEDGRVILTGSHIDTVVSGGRYDGAYGVASGIAALAHLRRTYGPPRRTLEAVSFAEEEGSRFPLTFWGSGHVAGRYAGPEAAAVSDASGIALKHAMEDCGFGGYSPGSLKRSDIAAYIELHIEQGITLERTGTEIGIVTAIAGQRRYEVRLTGSANHAGTTPMGLRRDGLAGAAEMLAHLEHCALEAGDPLVATAGRLDVKPNTSNVIPGEVSFSLDIRHSDEAELERFCAAVAADFGQIAARRGLGLELIPRLRAQPAPMDAPLCASIEAVCGRQGRPSRRMVSGAGHDAQLLAPRCRAAMIFVPSRDGISHSPLEHTPPEELAAGLDVLIGLLYELAYC